MLRVVVFDSGWGGEEVADFIEEELVVVEVIRVIDWRNAPYVARTREEILRLTEMALKKYLGRVDAVVIASFASSIVIDDLRRRYPQQQFLGFGWGEEMLGQEQGKKFLWLGDHRIRGFYAAEVGAALEGKEVLVVDCDHWPELIDDGEMDFGRLERELVEFKDMEFDGVIVFNTHFWELKTKIEVLFGGRVEFLDQRKQLLEGLAKVLDFNHIKHKARAVKIEPVEEEVDELEEMKELEEGGEAEGLEELEEGGEVEELEEGGGIEELEGFVLESE